MEIPNSRLKRLQGYLFKKGRINTKTWKKRWFILYEHKTLSYFTNEVNTIENGNSALGEINLYDVYHIEHMINRKNNIFVLHTISRKWQLKCENTFDFNIWLSHLQRIIYPTVICTGYLFKNGNNSKMNENTKISKILPLSKWKYRYFVLTNIQNNFELRYYEHENQHKFKGIIYVQTIFQMKLLPNKNSLEIYGKETVFELYTDHRIYVLSAGDINTRSMWFKALKRIVDGNIKNTENSGGNNNDTNHSKQKRWKTESEYDLENDIQIERNYFGNVSIHRNSESSGCSITDIGNIFNVNDSQSLLWKPPPIPTENIYQANDGLFTGLKVADDMNDNGILLNVIGDEINEESERNYSIDTSFDDNEVQPMIIFPKNKNKKKKNENSITMSFEKMDSYFSHGYISRKESNSFSSDISDNCYHKIDDENDFIYDKSLNHTSIYSITNDLQKNEIVGYTQLLDHHSIKWQEIEPQPRSDYKKNERNNCSCRCQCVIL